ncbi:MAG: ATP synthase F1 subunit delta [Verrucomicrobiae bacterium]|nr:ATP synthase F1 subunit delta [Verrucomicrobiae bacterium]
MPRDPVLTGYARALLDMAEAENAVGVVEQDLFRLRDLLRANPQLLEFLKNPNLKREGKRQALAELFEGRVHSLVLGWLLTLQDSDRVGRLPAIIEEFIRLAAEVRQTVAGEVITARPLEETVLEQMASALTRALGKNVHLYQRVDPSVLGGAIIKVGEQVIDGSLRYKLQQLQQQLAPSH